MKSLLVFLMIGVSSVMAQTEKIDLAVAQKIKQEEQLNSDIERLSYRLLDYAGPRLTGSDGMERGYKVAKEMMEEYKLSNPRIEFARDWPRGGWDIEKAYAAMTLPYYIPIFPAPVAWTNGHKRAGKRGCCTDHCHKRQRIAGIERDTERKDRTDAVCYGL